MVFPQIRVADARENDGDPEEWWVVGGG